MRSLKELMDLGGRVAVITGGAGHLGRTMGSALAELGATLVLVDVAGGCEGVAADIASVYSVQVVPLAMDLTDADALRSIPERVVSRFGRLDILVNNAALVGTSALRGWVVPFGEQQGDTWRLALEVNLTVPFLLTQACAAPLAVSGHGAVVNICSIYGVVGPNPGLYTGTDLGTPAGYAASKGGLVQLTRWLATTLAPHVRVNAITPAGIWRGQPEVFLERYKASTPLRRMAREEDFKGAIAYLATDQSEYVTGQNLIVDGGWTVW